jgi:hypothetical protein
MIMSVKFVAAAAFGAFVVSGPLQHLGVLPQTAVGDASKAAIKLALNLGTKEALACGFGGGKGWGNNGWGNGGGDGVPGGSPHNDIGR